MDGITDRETNRLASRGLEELFFQLCCCVSFWFWLEIGFGLHTYIRYLTIFFGTNIFLIVNVRFIIDSSAAFPSVFFGLGVTNKAAKPDCVLPIGDDGSMYEDRSSRELIVIIINES